MADETIEQAVDTVAKVAANEATEELNRLADEAADEVKRDAEGAFGKIEREIETWFNDLRGNLQGLETETHNKLYAAKEALKARLSAII